MKASGVGNRASGIRPEAAAVTVEVSHGELLDKIAILEIKAERITDAAKLRHVRDELAILTGTRDAVVPMSPALAEITRRLTQVNERLWQVEDDLRACEREADFGARFVGLARSVYQANDERAALKRQINELLGSRLVEEKSYT